MLISKIEFNKHSFFQDASIDLVNNLTYESCKNHTSIIIGPNGTGKSQILEHILKSLVLRRKDSNAATIHFTCNGTAYSTKENLHGKLNIDGACIAISNITADRFPLVASKQSLIHSNYYYLGQKSATNNIFLQHSSQRFAAQLLACSLSTERKISVERFLLKIDKPTSFKITIGKGSNYSLSANLLQDGKVSESKKFINSKLKSFIKNENSHAILENWNRQVSITLDFSNANDQIPYNLEEVISLIDMRILRVESVDLISKNSKLAYSDLSSGEKNILETMVSVITNIRNDSLIIIDEPEVSLHPSWQMTFLEYLDYILEDYNNCHTIIATHSHFILSNLTQKSGTIISLENKSSGGVESFILEDNCYGWPAEQVLYRVLGTTAFSNKYADHDLRVIIDHLAKKQITAEFVDAYKNISKFNITKENPIYSVLMAARKLINND